MVERLNNNKNCSAVCSVLRAVTFYRAAGRPAPHLTFPLFFQDLKCCVLRNFLSDHFEPTYAVPGFSLKSKSSVAAEAEREALPPRHPSSTYTVQRACKFFESRKEGRKRRT